MQKISKLYQHKHLNVQLTADEVPLDAGIKPYEITELNVLRDRLNETKSKMDKFYIGAKSDPDLNRRWTALQNAVDIFKPLRHYIEQHFQAQLVSNAWLKYWEIYKQYNIGPSEKEPAKYVAFFNAELPGAALCAFNHLMRTEYLSTKFEWWASSLAPDTSTTNDTASLGDFYGLYAQNKDRWLMQLGDESAQGKRRNDGDATNIENIRDWADTLGPKSKVGGVDIYSHDAGINVSETSEGELGFNLQETANARIHLGCALAGFMTLRPGGSFIAKQYTYFATFTWNLILIYATLFDEFYICKPLTSRPYNSEIYLVGKKFRGLPANIEKILTDRLVNFNIDPFIPFDAIRIVLSQQYSNILRFARLIFGQQIQFIDENLTLFDKYGNNVKVLNQGLEYIRAERREYWLRLYSVKSIDRALYIPYNKPAEKGRGEKRAPSHVKRKTGSQDKSSPQIDYEGLV